MTTAERGYLTRQFAAQRDWAGLWRLAQDLPLPDAVGAVALITAADDGWRPDRQRDRDLYALFTRIPPEASRDARDALDRDGAVRIEVPGWVAAGALAPGGSRVSVITRDGTRSTLSVCGLPDGQLLARHEFPAADFAALLDTGRALIAVTSSLAAEPAGARTRAYRVTGARGVEPTSTSGHYVAAMAAWRDALTAICPDGFLQFDQDEARFRTWPAGMERWIGLGGPPAMTAVSDPRTGLLLVSGDRYAFMVDAERARNIRETTRDVLIGLIFNLPPGNAPLIADEQQVRGRPRDQRFWLPRAALVRGLHDLVRAEGAGGRHEICGLDATGAITYLATDDFSVVTQPRELSGRTGTALWGSPDDADYALGGDGEVRVVTRELFGLRALAGRPQVTWLRADLVTAMQAESLIGQDSSARPFYELLVGCLEHRFGGDVRLGGAASEAGDDIAIGVQDEDAGFGDISGPRGVLVVSAATREGRS
jgi:hypothetical protein